MKLSCVTTWSFALALCSGSIAANDVCRHVVVAVNKVASRSNNVTAVTVLNGSPRTIRYCISGEVKRPEGSQWGAFPYGIEDGRIEKRVCMRVLKSNQSIRIPWNRRLAHVPASLEHAGAGIWDFRFRADVFDQKAGSQESSCVAVSKSFKVRDVFSSHK